MKQFEMWTAEHIPQLHEVFRVGPFIGECVEIVYDEENESIIATMEIDRSLPIDCLHCAHYFEDDPTKSCEGCVGMGNYLPKIISD